MAGRKRVADGREGGDDGGRRDSSQYTGRRDPSLPLCNGGRVCEKLGILVRDTRHEREGTRDRVWIGCESMKDRERM